MKLGILSAFTPQDEVRIQTQELQNFSELFDQFAA